MREAWGAINVSATSKYIIKFGFPREPRRFGNTSGGGGGVGGLGAGLCGGRVLKGFSLSTHSCEHRAHNM